MVATNIFPHQGCRPPARSAVANIVVRRDPGENLQLSQRRIGSQPPFSRTRRPQPQNVWSVGLPTRQSPGATDYKVWNAMSRTPSFSGTTKFIEPDPKRHRHDEDHEGAMRRKILSSRAAIIPGAPPAATRTAAARIMILRKNHASA